MEATAVNPALQSAILDKFGNPFGQATQKIVENMDMTVEKQEIVIEKQDEIGKKTKEVISNLEGSSVDFNAAFSRSSDGIKELTGGFVDLRGIIETIGKKFSALNDVFAPVGEAISGLFAFQMMGDRRKEKRLAKAEKKAEKRKAKEGSKLQKILGGVKLALFVTAGIGIFLLLRKFITSDFFVAIQDLIYGFSNAFDKTMLALGLGDEKKIRSRINRRDIKNNERKFNEGPLRADGTFRDQLKAKETTEEKATFLAANLMKDGVKIGSVGGKITEEGEDILSIYASMFDIDKEEFRKQFEKDVAETTKNLESGEYTETLVESEDQPGRYKKETRDKDGEEVVNIATESEDDVVVSPFKFNKDKIDGRMDDFGGIDTFKFSERTKEERDAAAEKKAAFDKDRRIKQQQLNEYKKLREFAATNGLGNVLDMMEGKIVKGGKTIRENAYFGPDAQQDREDTYKLMSENFKGMSREEMQNKLRVGGKAFESSVLRNFTKDPTNNAGAVAEYNKQRFLESLASNNEASRIFQNTHIDASSFQNTILSGGQSKLDDEGLNSSN